MVGRENPQSENITLPNLVYKKISNLVSWIRSRTFHADANPDPNHRCILSQRFTCNFELFHQKKISREIIFSVRIDQELAAILKRNKKWHHKL